MAKQQDIRITHMMVCNTPIAAIADMLLDKQILFCQVILGSISGGSFLISPVARQQIAMKVINDIADGCFQLLDRDMTMVEIGQLICVARLSQMPGHLM